MLLTGFVGAFTTFSTLMYETGALLRDAEWSLGAFNLLGQNIAGLVFLFLGLTAGRLL
jgi:CrcB protein